MKEKDLLIDCLRRLNAAGISYMLTGSMVSNYWGIPRTTHDVDFVVELPREAIPVLVRAFAVDFYLDEAAIGAAFQPPHQFNAIDRRSALKVDFWLLKRKPFEQTMFSRRTRVILFSEPAWICTAEDLVLHKLHWNAMSPSERQLADAAGVVAVQGEALDCDYMKHWARQLNVVDQLNGLLAGKIRPKQT